MRLTIARLSRLQLDLVNMHQSSALPSLPLFKQEVPLASSLGPITRLSPAPSTETFLATVRQFFAFGTPTQELCDSGILYLVNEFWTAKQRQAHAIHEISYRACFKPQLPEFFISRLTEPGESVHDPYMGRGTTPVQAALMGRKPIGNDVNPLSVLLTRPRLASASECWRGPQAPRSGALGIRHDRT